ncbi:MAG: malate synthase A [Cyanobacteriota/Melainabacteria group bacterium]
MTIMLEKVEIKGKSAPGQDRVLTEEAIDFLCELHHHFDSERLALLERRQERQAALDGGILPDFLVRTKEVRESEWKVAPAPHDLNDRRVEITGPVERKMMINALNSGAHVFMADFEDSLSPSWQNIIAGQNNLIDAVRGDLTYHDQVKGKDYKLNDEIATLVVRPRGWHLTENNIIVGGKPISASLFDFGLYFFHNVHRLREKGSAPYFYLPKLESYREARLWNEIFVFAQDRFEIPVGTIRATVLIETIMAAFEMDEILFELKDHAAGLNAGRWDYIFSMIKKLNKHPEFSFPDRSAVTMAVPFMRAYAQLLVKTCHHRGAHAIGGMAAFIPSRKDAEINKTAFAKVTEDKSREAEDGFDGTWVAHPDLVPVAKQVFDAVLKENPHQKSKLREDVEMKASDLLSTEIFGAAVTMEGLINNIDVALQYIDSWLRGNGAAAIYNLMEDAATAEISRIQVWQWLHRGATLVDGTTVTEALYQDIKTDLLKKLKRNPENRFDEAAEILDALILNKELTDFLTVPAYQYLLGDKSKKH